MAENPEEERNTNRFLDVESKRLLVSESTAAELLSIGRTVLKNYALNGTIPYIAIGHQRLYSPAALRVWIQSEIDRQSQES